jgi:chromosome condensin MukBEF MukE localization factor
LTVQPSSAAYLTKEGGVASKEVLEKLSDMAKQRLRRLVDTRSSGAEDGMEKQAELIAARELLRQQK